MKQWDILKILQNHKEGISSPHISKLMALEKGILKQEHLNNEDGRQQIYFNKKNYYITINEKKQLLSLNMQVYQVLKRLEQRHLVESFTIGDGAVYFRLIKMPVDERFKFQCPKCHTERIGNMGSLLLCANPECYQRNGKYRTRFWAKQSRML